MILDKILHFSFLFFQTRCWIWQGHETDGIAAFVGHPPDSSRGHEKSQNQVQSAQQNKTIMFQLVFSLKSHVIVSSQSTSPGCHSLFVQQEKLFAFNVKKRIFVSYFVSIS